jgi:hypothetical protein
MHYCSLARFVAEELEKKLRIPTLILTTKNFDSTFLPPAEFEFRNAIDADKVEVIRSWLRGCP